MKYVSHSRDGQDIVWLTVAERRWWAPWSWRHVVYVGVFRRETFNKGWYWVRADGREADDGPGHLSRLAMMVRDVERLEEAIR